MKEELENKLRAEFPKIYTKDDEISVSDGWYNIIRSLSLCITNRMTNNTRRRLYVRNQKKLGKFMDPVPSIPRVKIAQIKEKFGGLRFYINGGDNAIYNFIDMAETLSEVTCEDCGSPGVKRSSGWIRCLCDNCHNTKRKNND